MAVSKDLRETLETLTPEELRSLMDYIQSKLSKNPDAARRFLSLSWAGELKDLQSEYRSGIEAQDEAKRLWEKSGK